MSTHATGTFEVKSWEEKPYQEIEGGGKLTRASVTQDFHGDIEGSGAVEYLMTYRADGTASFVVQQRVEGRLGGRSGTFVLQGSGTYAGEQARATWSVVPGSGTGELRGLKGGASPPRTDQTRRSRSTMTSSEPPVPFRGTDERPGYARARL